MSRTPSESAVIRALAAQVCDRLTRRTTATLQRTDNAPPSGDDSGLTNTCVEICAQVQFQLSCSWEDYDETVRGLLASDVKKLPPHEREAVWLQPPPADERACEDQCDREPYPIADDGIVEYLTKYIYGKAADWNNRRIRQYLE
jgi:hypothetical protein